MSCNCSQLDQIPECTDSILLGSIDPDTEYYIYVKNSSTGFTYREEVTSDELGHIELDLTQPDPTFYNQESSYEVWVTLRDSNERLEITYAYGLTDTCLALSFFRLSTTIEEEEI